LDASTAAAIMGKIVTWARSTGGVVIAALQAPTPELVALFDDTLLLSRGRALYHGPSGGLEPYLAGLRFPRPGYKDAADFAAQLATAPELCVPPHGEPQPDSLLIGDIAAAWDASKGGQAAAAAAAVGGKHANRSGADGSGGFAAAAALAAAHPTSKPLSSAAYVLMLLARQLTLTRRNGQVLGAKVGQSAIMGLILGSLFFQAPEGAFVLRVALATFACTFVAFSSQAQMPSVFTSKDIVRRQVAGRLYPPGAYAAATLLTAVPLSALAILIFGSLTYWMAGFVADASRWGVWLLVLFAMDLCMNSIFRLIAYITPGLEVAQVVAGSGTGVLFMLAGFLIVRSKLPDYGA
jgi:ATP-binding cassette subfamily G (WHITE) protein 2 (SNQ2)